MSDPQIIKVEVAFARPDEQAIYAVELELGSTAEQAIVASGIIDKFPEIDLSEHDVGVFGKAIKPTHVLRAGDRVEIYRALLADPKEVRRQMAEVQRLAKEQAKLELANK